MPLVSHAVAIVSSTLTWGFEVNVIDHSFSRGASVVMSELWRGFFDSGDIITMMFRVRTLTTLLRQPVSHQCAATLQRNAHVCF